MKIAIVAKVEDWQRTKDGFHITFTDNLNAESTLDIIHPDQVSRLIGKDYDKVILDPLADDHAKLLARAATETNQGEVETL